MQFSLYNAYLKHKPQYRFLLIQEQVQKLKVIAIKRLSLQLSDHYHQGRKHSQLETLHTERKVVLLCYRLMRGIKKPSRLLFPLIISASLKFERSPFFNHQFCTIQPSTLGSRFLNSTKKARPLRCLMKRFMCLLRFVSAPFDLQFGQF